MKKDFILAIFDDEEKMIASAESVRSKQIDIYDFYTPFPVHGLDELLGIKRSILPYVTFLAGAAGLGFAIFLQVYTSAVDWPINVGGKPFLSGPAFIPIGFELTVLFAAHTTVGAFCALNKLFPGKKPVIFHENQTDHKFVLVIEKNNNDISELKSIIGDGAEDVYVKNMEMDS